jgi:hypothetical protein
MADRFLRIEGYKGDFQEGFGFFDLGERDMVAIAMLADPVLGPEMFWDDPNNHDYNGCYRVRDHQYPMFRGDPDPNTFKARNNEGFACGRDIGKTESIKGRAWTHPFRRRRVNLLLTAPELIHLLPLTDAIEDRIRDTRLTRDLLDTRGGQTGFTHKPFGVDFYDGTKIVGRIPRLTGTGVKGQHQPDLIMDEGQDYPQRGWDEIFPTVMRDTLDSDGDPDYHFNFYGVHSGERDTGFFRAATDTTVWTIHTITRLHSAPRWNPEEKQTWIAAYGGTSSPDYRRNVLGEAGAAASAFFVASRLMLCVDQQRNEKTGEMSRYNEVEYVKQVLRAEELDHYGITIEQALDLPEDMTEIWGGMDVGLTLAPSVIHLYEHRRIGTQMRMKLRRRIILERFRSRTQREALYAIWRHFGGKLKGFGIDSTGLGFPFFQELEDDEAAPTGLLAVTRGYKFNANVPVGVDEQMVAQDSAGRLKDQYGSQVKKVWNPDTGADDYIVEMPMIEAATRYLREQVDTTFLLLPFDPDLIRDMRAETQQRVQRIAGLKSKPMAFHDLDAMRAYVMPFKAGKIEAILNPVQEPVMDYSLNLGTPSEYDMLEMG